MGLSLSAIYCYPVKSLGEILLNQADVDRFGIQHDRRWMLVDANGRFLTQRQLPQMVHIRVRRMDSGWQLQAGEQQMSFTAQEPADAAPCEVTVWRDTVTAVPAEEAVSAWLSEQLGRECRLVYMPESTRRLVDPGYAKNQETVGFADGFPMLLTSEASLQDFNRHLSQPIEMLRFRPNLVVKGGTPWQEDHWKVIRIGELEFDVAKPCSRCAIPTINRQTAAKEPEVFKALRKHRSKDGEVYFGQNLIPRQHGKLRAGDTVEVIE